MLFDLANSGFQISTSNTPSANRLVSTAARLFLPVAATLAAGGIGYLIAVLPVIYYSLETHRTRTLGVAIEYAESFQAARTRAGMDLESFRRSTAQAFHDPEEVLERLERISYSVPTAITPFVGYAPEPGLQDNALISKLQLRGGPLLQSPKPSGVYRIFVTGASVPYGSGAPSDETTIGGYLQKMLDRDVSPTAGRTFEVYTLATPTWSSTHERIVIENRISELDPDLTIAISGVADVHYGSQGHNVLWSRAITDQLYWNLFRGALERAGFGPLTDVADVASHPVPPVVVADRLEKNARLASVALGLARGEYFFFLQPTAMTTRKPLTRREQAWRDLTDRRYHAACYRAIRERLAAVELANFHYADMAGVFDKVPGGEELFTDVYHFGDKGNEMIARFVLDALRKELWQQR